MTGPANDRAQQKEAFQALDKSLRLWGVGNSSSEHVDFARKARWSIEDYLDKDSMLSTEATKSRKPLKLSNDFIEAMETVLRGEIEGFPEESGRLLVSDSLRMKNFEIPPYFYSERRDKFVLKFEYKDKPLYQIDPLYRFDAVKVSKSQFFFSQWALDLSSVSIKGHIFEGIVASYAIHNEICYNCKCRSLRWDGGPEGSWTDMICIGCHSIFEIKSKENKDIIESASIRKRMFGGSYKYFHKVHQSKKLSTGWKHYLVTVSRKSSFLKVPKFGPGLHQCWDVQIAEIDRVLPILTPTSFINTGSNVIFRSDIVIRKELTRWFCVPWFEIQQEQVVMKILEEQFPGMTKQLEDRKKRNISSDSYHQIDSGSRAVTTNIRSTDDSKNTAHDSIEELRKGLENLNAGVDDWEDLDSSDDDN